MQKTEKRKSDMLLENVLVSAKSGTILKTYGKCNIKTIFWAREEIHVQSHQNAPVIGPLTLSVYHET